MLIQDSRDNDFDGEDSEIFPEIKEEISGEKIKLFYLRIRKSGVRMKHHFCKLLLASVLPKSGDCLQIVKNL